MPHPFPWLRLNLLSLAIAWFGTGATASAQDFQVVTTVSQYESADSRWRPVASSITWFHAGKVYDYMEDVGEVVIFDPVQSRFMILSFNGNHLATTLEFSQLQQYLKVARAKTHQQLERIRNARRRDALAFQLNPEFEETFDPATGTLTLVGPLIRYEVETDTADKPQAVQQYLNYADWAARLNFVLHSSSLHPEVRLAVNKALSQRDRLPTRVRLHLDGDTTVQYQASHKFEWTLKSTSHSFIRRCEQARTAEETRWVDFLDYQRASIATTARN